MVGFSEHREVFCAYLLSISGDISLAILGAVGRLAFEHARFGGLTLQFWYELFRAFFLAFLAILIIKAIVINLSFVPAVSIGVAAATGFYSKELLTGLMNCVGPLINKVVKPFTKGD